MSEPGRLRDRVPVESLDDERLSRIERNLVLALPARAPARRAFAPWLAAAAIAAAAVMLAWQFAPSRDEAPSAAAPTVVVAGEGGARVDLGDAVVVAGAGAAFTVARPDGGVDITLATGRIELDVEPRKGRPPLIVHADDVAVVVVGTKFSVERGDEVIVDVTEGVVRVERGGASDVVAAGQAWSEPARTAVAMIAPVPAPVPAPDRVEPAVDVDVLHDREAAVPEVDAGPDEPPVAPKGSGKRPPKDRTPKPEVRIDPMGELLDEIKAQGLTGSGEGEARKLYDEALALFRDDKPRDALRRLDQYDTRFPRNAAASWLRVRIACTHGITDPCRKAATTYVNRHDDGGRRAAIARRIKTTR